MTTNTTFNFAPAPKRFDDVLASTGVDVPVVDDSYEANYRGTWTLKLRDENDQRYRAAELRYYKTNANRIRMIKEDHLQKMDKLVELCVVGWKDIKDADGNDVPFSKEAAKAYLSQEDCYFDLNYLWFASAQTSLFRKDEVASKEDVAGN